MYQRACFEPHQQRVGFGYCRSRQTRWQNSWRSDCGAGPSHNALTEVETATGFANMSGEALRQIVSDADATADQVRAIATASEQQPAASEEINQSIL